MSLPGRIVVKHRRKEIMVNVEDLIHALPLNIQLIFGGIILLLLIVRLSAEFVNLLDKLYRWRKRDRRFSYDARGEQRLKGVEYGAWRKKRN